MNILAANLPVIARQTARVRRTWRFLRSGLWFGPGQYKGNYRRLDRLYDVEDPWKLTSLRERIRFEMTNAVIARVLPRCGALLEIGSGEGTQTAYLLKVARRVTGLEVSPLAAGRARRRVPQVMFHIGRAEKVEHIVEGERFDMITACEVLYYTPEPAAIMAQLQRLTPRILVTNYEKRAEKLAHLFTGPGWMRLEDIAAEGTRWRCHLWIDPALEA